MSSDYILKFELQPYEHLDKFALLADQGYNLGDKGDWFLHFRKGLEGLNARLLGVRIHYLEVYAWTIPKPPLIIEYHLSSILFNMDSAIECMVYTLNALGYIAEPTQFLDVTDDTQLKKISPYNILGRPPDYKKGLMLGYDNYLPSLKSYWQENTDLLLKISEQHDVSKHRKAIFEGGRMRTDPPPGFFESLGVGDDKGDQLAISPMAEILLRPKPKIPAQQLHPSDHETKEKLEDLAENFCSFINMCGEKALDDARNRIKLNHYGFLKL
jgi:hypothetical protein